MGGREERKVVTVLFTDLVGFTSRAEELDPEDVRAMLAPYHAGLREQIEQHGGTVEKFIGDAVMAVFGAPVSHEDDPLRAVLAAIAISESVGGELEIRTAVNTGEALVLLDADPAAGEAFVSGDVVNTAARLQASAPVNGILVGEATYRATRNIIDYREAAAVEAKGKAQPVPVWEVIGARSRFGSDVEETHTGPLVGREREVFLLRDALERAKREQTAQLVTLVGVPGIGKSRLVAELFSVLAADPDLYWWRQGRSLPYGESRSVWALGEIVKAQAGILETDDTDTATTKLAQTVADLFSDEEECAWVDSHLRALAGIAVSVDESANRSVEAFAAWRRFFEALAEERPLVLVFEDLHWADDALLDFVDHLAEWASGVPMLIVASARPELLDRRPAWGGGKRNALTLSVGALSEEETAQLLPILPAEKQQFVLERAEGNPLYAAEYARMMSEHDSNDLPLPETVQGVIAARIDALPAAEKTLLQNASVLGKVFWPNAIGNPDEALLHALERKEFVRRDRRSSVAGETQFAFHHLLVRDVAYAQIPRARRLEKHRDAALWIAALSPDRSDDRAEMLAHHYREALALAAVSGVDVEPFKDDACDALVEASERATALSSWTTAADLAAEGLALMDADDSRRADLQLRLARGNAFGTAGQIDLGLVAEALHGFLARGDVGGAAEAAALQSWMHWWQGEGAAAHERLEQAMEIARDLPTSTAKARVFAQAARLEAIGGDPETALRLSNEAISLAEELSHVELLARSLNSRGIAKGNLGDESAVDDLRESVQLADRSRAPNEIVVSRNNLASALISNGNVKEGLAVLDDAVSEAFRYASPLNAEWPMMQQLLNRIMTSDWDGTLAETDRLEATASPGSQVRKFMGHVRGAILAARGQLDAAFPLIDKTLSIARETQERQAIGPILTTMAFALHLAGRDADPVLDDLLGNELLVSPRYATWQLPLLLVERGRVDDWVRATASTPGHNRWRQVGLLVAGGDYAGAAEMYSEIGATFLEAWARLLAAEQGDIEQLGRARAFFAAERAEPFLRRCEALLSASA